MTVPPSENVTREPATCELLAPAGDWECLRAACANGADAIYFGLSDFNARYRAHNFTLEELPEVMEYLHRHNVRGYVTMNTLIFSDELEAAAKMIGVMATAGVDAVIVQDLGLAQLIHEVAPQLPIHGSTQMTLTEPQGIEYVRRLGVERVILARELSLADVKKIKAVTDLPVEVFVHGALCVAYSGQCLTSEALGGRSANRGQCAQACRLPYDLVVDGETRDLGDIAYLLSPQDLAAYDFIDELVEAGVCSLKIEGRLKSAHYVAATTKTYRAALDAALAKQAFKLDRQAEIDLQQSFSRGFSPGFLKGLNHQRLVGGRFPKARGVRIGDVVGTTAAGILVDLGGEHETTILKAGDGCVFDEGHPDQDEQGGRLYGVRVVDSAPHGGRPKRIEIFFAEGSLNRSAIAQGAIVWRTDDPTMRRRMEQTFNREPLPRRTAISFHAAGRVGGPLTLTVRDFDGRECSAVWDGPLQLAQKHPLSVETLREQCGRLGETPFELGPESSNSVTLDAVEPIMVPKSVLNDLRRRAVDELLAARLAAPRARPVRLEALNELRGAALARREAEVGAATPPSLYVLARTLPQLEAVLAWRPEAPAARPAMVYCDFEDVRRYKEAMVLAREAGLPIGLATLRILKPGEEGLFAVIARNQPDAVLVRNLAAVEHFKKNLPAAQLIGDFSLNAANELTAEQLFGEGLARLVPSYDLSWEQLTALAGRSVPSKFETVVHQHMPMFHMEHCVFAHTLSNGTDATNCGRPCDHHRVSLRDRVGAEFPLVADTGCRNTVFNSVPQSAAEYLPRMLALGLRHFRVELLLETPEQVGPLLESYARGLAGLDAGRSTWRGLQILNQLGVTRGTLQTS